MAELHIDGEFIGNADMPQPSLEHSSEILSGIPIEEYEEPFARAIVESPNDPTPKLVFADWLDEQGDMRGELIRVRVEFWRAESRDRLRELADRELKVCRILSIKSCNRMAQFRAWESIRTALAAMGCSAAEATENVRRFNLEMSLSGKTSAWVTTGDSK